MKLIDLKNSGRIISISYGKYTDDKCEEYEYADPIELEDEKIFLLEIDNYPVTDGEYTLEISNSEGTEGQQVLRKRSWNCWDSPYIVKISTPITVLLDEYIQETEKDKKAYALIFDVLSKSGQFEKEEFTKRNQNAINKYCEHNSIPVRCSYTNYSEKCVNFYIGKETYSLRLFNHDCTELQYIKNWVERCIRDSEILIENAKLDIQKLPVYVELNKKMVALRTEIKSETETSCEIIQKKFPLLFGE